MLLATINPRCTLLVLLLISAFSPCEGQGTSISSKGPIASLGTLPPVNRLPKVFITDDGKPEGDSSMAPQVTGKDYSTMNAALCLAGGSFGLGYGLVKACSNRALSSDWWKAFPAIFISCFITGRSLLPYSKGRIDITESVFLRLVGAHLFSTTSAPLLTSILWPEMKKSVQKGILIFSMTLACIGMFAEVIAHFQDRWLFMKGGHAADGVENIIFSVCLVGSFSFLAAALVPSTASLFFACFPPLMTLLIPAFMPWSNAKAIVYGSQSLVTFGTTAVFMRYSGSAWPLLYGVQAVNVIRNGKRILKTGHQALHVFPSVYGWFSYIFPFALALNPGTKSAGLWVVLLASVLSVVATDMIERQMLKGCTTSLTG